MRYSQRCSHLIGCHGPNELVCRENWVIQLIGMTLYMEEVRSLARGDRGDGVRGRGLGMSPLQRVID
ncbi:hypothetical protein J6590_017398 [Homalodisca vitripennis]|nr:hypothetical protein J6590_017398 [Homalodisca vitripennis]